jgi:hypothetical protein
MTAEAGDELLDAVAAYVVAQQRLLGLLDTAGVDGTRVKAAMFAELDQLAAAMELRGRRPHPPLRDDPGA